MKVSSQIWSTCGKPLFEKWQPDDPRSQAFVHVVHGVGYPHAHSLIQASGAGAEFIYMDSQESGCLSRFPQFQSIPDPQGVNIAGQAETAKQALYATDGPLLGREVTVSLGFLHAEGGGQGPRVPPEAVPEVADYDIFQGGVAVGDAVKQVCGRAVSWAVWDLFGDPDTTRFSPTSHEGRGSDSDEISPLQLNKARYQEGDRRMVGSLLIRILT